MFNADAKGFKLIHKAALENDVEGTARLLEKRTEIDPRTDTGQTPLHLATSKGHTRVIHVLLGYRADVNARDHQGMTPLHVAAAHGYSRIMTDLLTETGGDVNLPDLGGNTPLHLAAGLGQAGVMEILLTHGANINAKNNNGNTPLHEAVEHQSMKVVKKLLDRHARVNEGDNFARAPLSLAAKAGAKNIAEQLIDHGADVNAADKFGSTPLHEAALHGQLRVTALLLHHGADAEKNDQLGRTPCQAAAANGQRDMVSLLQKYTDPRAGRAKPAPSPSPPTFSPSPPPLTPAPASSPSPLASTPAPQPQPATPAPAPPVQERNHLSVENKQQSPMIEDILNAIPDYLLLVDRELRFTFVNRHAALALGLAQENFPGKTWQELGLPLESMVPLAGLCAAVFASRQAQRGMLTLPSHEGAREMACLVSPIHRADGEVASILCVAHDIVEDASAAEPSVRDLEQRVVELQAANARLRNEAADQRRAAEALRIGEERFRLLVEAGSEGVIFAEDGIIVEANPQVSLITGYQRHELIGKRVLDLIHPEYSELAWEHIAALYHVPCRCYFLHKDGIPLWVELQGKMMSIRGRQVSVVIMRPIEDAPPSSGGEAFKTGALPPDSGTI